MGSEVLRMSLWSEAPKVHCKLRKGSVGTQLTGCGKSPQNWERQRGGGHLVENVPKKVSKSTWISRSKVGKKQLTEANESTPETRGKRGGQECGLPPGLFLFCLGEKPLPALKTPICIHLSLHSVSPSPPSAIFDYCLLIRITAHILDLSLNTTFIYFFSFLSIRIFFCIFFHFFFGG